MKERLAAQLIAPRGTTHTPAEIVAWFGAMQAQDYKGSKWALGLRTGQSLAAVDAAIERGEILRTHALRWTWQIVVPADIRWMLSLTAERAWARAGTRYEQLGLDKPTFAKVRKVLSKTLSDGVHRTREELGAALETAGVITKEQRLPHLLGQCEVDGVICSGTPRLNKLTYALLDERAPELSDVSRDEALAMLATRYFRSHAPATLADFVWWSGLRVADARRGMDAAKIHEIEPVPVARGKDVYLLPAFDEYVVAYRDRSAILTDAAAKKYSGKGNGMLSACVIVDGQVSGTWVAAKKGAGAAIEPTLYRKLTAVEQTRFSRAAKQYASFLDDDT